MNETNELLTTLLNIRQGRMPSTLQKAVDTGRSLDDFKIK
jgi:hypothetical protein